MGFGTITTHAQTHRERETDKSSQLFVSAWQTTWILEMRMQGKEVNGLLRQWQLKYTKENVFNGSTV